MCLLSGLEDLKVHTICTIQIKETCKFVAKKKKSFLSCHKRDFAISQRWEMLVQGRGCTNIYYYENSLKKYWVFFLV